MKLPTLEAVLEVGNVLVLCNGEEGTILDLKKVDGEMMAKIDWDDRLSSSEEYQSIKSIVKWVERGIWKIRR